jgi:formyltetrahydrofolate-dependent phosphoribosylglycinamide formyltransferase
MGTSAKLGVGVVASGGGSNLQALIDACQGDAPARVALVVSNVPGAGALQRAVKAGIPTLVLEDTSEAGAGVLIAELRRLDVRLLVLAGYLKMLPTAVINALGGAVINVHPALLPAFGGKGMYGLRVHRAVLASGVTLSGVTVHQVSAEYDTGPIVAQWPVPVHAGDTPESLAKRVLGVEHRLLPAVVFAAATANGRLTRLASRIAAFAPADHPPELSGQFTSKKSRG